MKRLLALLLILLFPVMSGAATYYVDQAASNDTGDGSSGSPKKYISSGVALLSSSGGDTLIIMDGTYSNASDNIRTVPGSAAGPYNTIQAETVGGVVCTTSDALLISGSSPAHYLKIDGIIFKYAGGKGINGDHIKITRCGFKGGATYGNTVNFGMGDGDYAGVTHDVLVEECFFWGGGGRYSTLHYGTPATPTYNIVYRRCVTSPSAGWTGDDQNNPSAGMMSYNSNNVYYQNCIVLDTKGASITNWTSPFYETNDGSNSVVEYHGCISINNDGHGIMVDPKNGGSITGMVINDFVAYDNGGSSTASLVLHSTQGTASGAVANATVGGEDYGAYVNGSGTWTLTNSILFDIGDTHAYGVTPTYCNLEGGSTSNNCTDYDPEGLSPLRGLKYLVRIEDGGSLLTAGSGGGQVGATIMKKIGVSGTLYGESGWNTVTDDNLWPFPYEDLIRTNFRDTRTTGFCANDQTLTKYIWEYLGSQIPSDIYAGAEPAPSLTSTTITGGGSMP